jgi:hypothetical protein
MVPPLTSDVDRAAERKVPPPPSPPFSSARVQSIKIFQGYDHASPTTVQLPQAPAARQSVAATPSSALDDWNFVLGLGGDTHLNGTAAPLSPRSHAAGSVSLMSLGDGDLMSTMSNGSMASKKDLKAIVPKAPSTRVGAVPRS